VQPSNKAVEVPSRRFGKYLVRSRLGSGGMAEVFLAEAIDEKGDHVNVALKLMRPGMSEDKFADEVDLMGMLSHPNLVRMIEHGVAFGRLYIALEFLIGGDLQEVMEAHRRQMRGFPVGMGVHIVIEVLKGLAYFHTATTLSGTPLNLIHSDVNPANLFFSGRGEVKLGDFGVASSSELGLGPGEGVAAGKLSYLSPEQTRGELLTPASDLWAVGVMLYELVVGYHPFQKDGATEEQVMATIRAPRLAMPDYVDKPLATIITKALTPDLRNRYRTAGEFAGPLFSYALDNNLLPTPPAMQEWLEGVLGLLV
jgi:eukaryotic-like serine/threonine-protein kinase